MTAPEQKASIRHFLKALFAGKPDGLFMLLWTLGDKTSRWFSDVDSAIKWVEQLEACDVYVGVGLSGEDYGPMNRCVSNNTAGLVGAWMDIDLKSEAHKNPALPSTVKEALSILPAEMPPTIVVFTGNGIHVWWLFREPWIFHNDAEREKATTLAKRWNTFLRDNGRMKGWKLERLNDLARLLRIPGTTNCKEPANLKPVVFLSQSDRHYNPEDIEEFLDDHGVPDNEAEEAAQKQFAERFKDAPLKIDLSAQVPEAKLDLWLSSDKRFFNTWFRQRPDLIDQSQSGYDLALANFGYRIGLDDQGIIDLITHHRRIHKQKPRNSLDYFHRTLSKASQNPPPSPGAQPDTEPSPFAEDFQEPAGTTSRKSGAGPAPFNDRDKIQLCKNISEALGIDLIRIVKLPGRTPIYRMELAQGKIEFHGPGKLIKQSIVRDEIAGRVGWLIPKMKAKMWDHIAQAMLNACIVEDGGEEMESDGAARIYIAHYLAENSFISFVEDQMVQNQRKPMIRDGRITVCTSDLQLYINKSTQQSLSMIAVAAMLSGIGAKSFRLRIKRKEQSRWELPVDDFDPRDFTPEGGETHETPRG